MFTNYHELMANTFTFNQREFLLSNIYVQYSIHRPWAVTSDGHHEYHLIPNNTMCA